MPRENRLPLSLFVLLRRPYCWEISSLSPSVTCHMSICSCNTLLEHHSSRAQRSCMSVSYELTRSQLTLYANCASSLSPQSCTSCSHQHLFEAMPRENRLPLSLFVLLRTAQAVLLGDSISVTFCHMSICSCNTLLEHHCSQSCSKILYVGRCSGPLRLAGSSIHQIASWAASDVKLLLYYHAWELICSGWNADFMYVGNGSYPKGIPI